MLSKIYSKSSISNSPSIATTISTCLESYLIPSLSSQETHEVHDLFNALAMDLVTAHLFTSRHSTRFLESKLERYHFFVDLYQSRRRYFAWSSEIPILVWLIGKATFGRFRIVPGWVDDVNTEIENWNMKMCQACEDNMADEKTDYEDCVYYRLRSRGILSQLEAASEVLDHIG